jgi:hypothetical protein
MLNAPGAACLEIVYASIPAKRTAGLLQGHWLVQQHLRLRPGVRLVSLGCTQLCANVAVVQLLL